MFSRRSDLPLQRDPHARFLPWLIAFMVYLAVLAMAGVFQIAQMAERWERGVGDTMSVQIPAAAGADDRAVQEALNVLRTTPGVVRAEPLAEQRILDLLRPWLGDAADAADLPLPRMIDVTVDRQRGVDAPALQRRLRAVVPGASVDDHRVWLDRLISLLRTVEALGAAVLALIGLVTVGTVVFTTRTGLSIHHEAIEVLHLIGARDAYVARQFAGRALALGFRGGLIGLLFAVPTLIGLGYLAGRMEAGVLPDVGFGPVQWAAIAVLPVLAAAIAMLTARVTVLRTLARML